MPTTSHDDRWLLPRRQTEYPTWSLLPEAKVHGRREATYLVLAAMFLVATTTLFVLGTRPIIDVSVVITTVLPDLELPIALLLPFGVIPFATSFVAIALVGELYGRRRAAALVGVGLVASIALVGLLRLASVLDGRDTFGASLAFAACYLVAHASHVVLFEVMRRRTRGRLLWLRLNGASLIAQVAGWSTFAFVLQVHAGYVAVAPDPATITALAIGSAAYSIAGVFVLAIPVILAAHGLALFLRLGRDQVLHGEDDKRVERSGPVKRPVNAALAEGSVARKLPAAEIVDEADDPPVELPRRRPARASIPPYSSAEMRFFTEGDQLGAE